MQIMRLHGNRRWKSCASKCGGASFDNKRRARNIPAHIVTSLTKHSLRGKENEMNKNQMIYNSLGKGEDKYYKTGFYGKPS